MQTQNLFDVLGMVEDQAPGSREEEIQRNFCPINYYEIPHKLHTS